MNTVSFEFCNARLCAFASGALWWENARILCVSDLHLGKSERIARRGGSQLPPYETAETLAQLAADLDRTGAATVICLGDSFDDGAASKALSEENRQRISALQAGRNWIWITGNHDPGPIDLSGSHLGEFRSQSLVFRHIAEPSAEGEVSGHYHPKAPVRTRLRTISRPAFLVDDRRIILPAFGTYTGGLRCDRNPLAALMGPEAKAILSGNQPVVVPMPR